MSGHNKWSKIKHKKEVSDAKKSKEFGKLARLIAVESKLAHGDVNSPALKTVIDKAKSINMPKDNIDRAVQKGKTDTGVSLQRVTYELYGPGGVAIIIEGLTDNNNRTNQEIKHLLSKQGYALGERGSAAWAFAKEGDSWNAVTTVPITEDDAEKLEVLIESIEEFDDVQEVCTNAEQEPEQEEQS